MKLLGWYVGRSKPQTQFLGDLVRLQLSAGDVCVLMARSRLPAEQMELISLQWRGAVGEDVTLIVLDDGMRLGVLSPPQAVAIHERLTDQKAVEVAVE